MGQLSSSQLLKRANDLKAPFLQCYRFFHTISINEMMSIMPIEGVKNLDLNLDHSLRDINQMKNSLKYDVFFWYCVKDTQKDSEKSCNPLKVIELISKENYKIWHTKNPEQEKLDKLTYRIKESKLVIIGISNDFAIDEQCMQVYEMVKNIIKKNYLIVEFGEKGKSEWLQKPEFAPICTDCRVIMQDPKRFSFKLNEMFEILERQLKDSRKDLKQDDAQHKDLDVFISYRWSNSRDAVKKGTLPTKTSLGWLDPRDLVEFFKKNNINAWIDVEEGNAAPGLFGQITKGLNEASVVIACFSDEYSVSQNCLLEFRFAHSSLKKPLIKCIVGLGNEWKKHEIAFLGGIYPEINFQYENPGGFDELLNLVKAEIEKCTVNKQKKIKDKIEIRNKAIENNNAAIQELYELTQRKFLKQIIQSCDKMSVNRAYPRLFFLDLIEQNLMESIERKTVYSMAEVDEKSPKLQCIKLMCEHEEGWHSSNSFFVYNQPSVMDCAYLARVMNILKYSNLHNELLIFRTEQGTKLIQELEAKSNENELIDSYIGIRKILIREFDKGTIWSTDIKINNDENVYNRLGLERCELKNGKILWLCKQHRDQTEANLIQNNYSETTSNSQEQIFNQMLAEIENINLDI